MELWKVQALADGSSMLGEMALEKGLIDQVGSYKDVEKYLEDELGIKDPAICW
ncbi:MAG TPA: hypothetical protein QGH03_01875 [Candidatus Paceibacterota bacterium]|jgi:ClpP class serine protease|nr:hypothetical protein [Candidatus Paceibacterota bacterium]